MTTSEPFWMIHGKGCGTPTVRHPTAEAAALEAKRLARANPGTEFVILQSVASALKTDVEFKLIRPSPAVRRSTGFQDLDLDIPF